MNAITRRGLLTAGLGVSAGVLATATVTATASAAAATGAVAATGREPASSQPRRLRVMSFNIHHAEGVDGVLDLERIASVIRRAKPDVVGLQEVDRHWDERSAWEDQPRWLAKRLGWEYAFGANLDEDPPSAGKPRRQYGNALLTRFRILSWRNSSLPRFEGGEQRGLLQVRTPVGRFASTHLQHDNAEERRAQAEAVVALLDESSDASDASTDSTSSTSSTSSPSLNNPNGPTVVVGDLNALPDSPELSPLFDAYADSWPRVGDGTGFTYPAEGPDRRIDYVLADTGLRPVRAEVIDTDASDHLPYLVEYAR